MIDIHNFKHYLKAMVRSFTSSRRWLVLAVLLSLALIPAVVWAGAVVAANAGHGGEELNLKPLLTIGKTNLIDFYSPFCPPCVQLAPVMERLAAKRSDLAIYKVNINRPDVRAIDWRSPLAQQFKIRQVPYFMIFSPQGKLVAQGPSAVEQVKSWLKEAGLMK
ncbi:MAG: thioredoxin family protein [Desulfobaccales bacterium]